jgi:predicted RNase H-like nuclease (RuvC/YqgF family)
MSDPVTPPRVPYITAADEVERLERLQALVEKWCQRAIEAEAEVAEREVQITRLEETVERLTARTVAAWDAGYRVGRREEKLGWVEQQTPNPYRDEDRDREQLARLRSIAAQHDQGRGGCVCQLCSVLADPAGQDDTEAAAGG